MSSSAKLHHVLRLGACSNEANFSILERSPLNPFFLPVTFRTFASSPESKAGGCGADGHAWRVLARCSRPHSSKLLELSIPKQETTSWKCSSVRLEHTTMIWGEDPEIVSANIRAAPDGPERSKSESDRCLITASCVLE